MTEEQDRGFKIQDRRRFSEEGEARSEAPSDEAPQAPPPRTESAASAEWEGSAAEPGGEIGAITFSTLVISLSTQALFHMGEIPDPQSGKVVKNAPGARQVIDMLGVLREKTQGNLDRAEQQLLDGILYDLRMKYVELVRR